MCDAHHYRIEEPNGPTVRGVCQRCGFERLFATGEESDLEFMHGRANARPARKKGWKD